MAGNSVILKPSPTTALSANLFAEVLWDCGVPQDAFQVIHGEGEIAAAIIEGGVDLVSFTGSYATGVKVVEATARTLAKTIIELGGSNPFIVCADADLDKAAEVAVDSAFSNAGQRCSSASRVIIEDSVYSSFRELFVEKANRLSFGMSPEVDVSTLINPESVAAFEGFLGNVEEAGGSILRLGTAVSEQREGGCVAQPALIEGLGIAHELASEEFFGPATRFFSFTSDDEAAAAANSTEYGLTAAVWSRDIPRAERIVRALEAGVISINGPTHGAEINMPFGGVKNSGNGSRDAGVYSIDQYSDTRVVSTFFGA
jgi:aldehyde dehydrogenase (NAD+)